MDGRFILRRAVTFRPKSGSIPVQALGLAKKTNRCDPPVAAAKSNLENGNDSGGPEAPGPQVGTDFFELRLLISREHAAHFGACGLQRFTHFRLLLVGTQA